MASAKTDPGVMGLANGQGPAWQAPGGGARVRLQAPAGARWWEAHLAGRLRDWASPGEGAQCFLSVKPSLLLPCLLDSGLLSGGGSGDTC